MKVMQLINSLDCGGLETLTVELAKSLQERNIEVEITCIDQKGVLAEQAQAAGIAVFLLGERPKFNWRQVWRLRNLLRKRQVDILHTHNIKALIYGSLAAPLAGVKALQTHHGLHPKKVPSWIWNLNQYIVSVSRVVEENTLQINQMKESKRRIVYNGIDLKRFVPPSEEEQQSLRQELGIAPGSFVIGHAGRISEVKAQDVLLRATHVLLQHGLDVTLVIAGDGPLLPKLKELAQELEMTDKVLFLGFRSDVARVLKSFDCMVLSSRFEGMPLVVLEAMATKKPVVVTRVGGNPEVVLDQETGLLVPPADPEQLAEAMGKFYHDRKLAAWMGEKGLERVQQEFSLDKMTEEYCQLYQQMLR